MKMIPAFKDYLWGGERLRNEYGKTINLKPVAESWEVSCHPEGLSLIGNGEYAGRTLSSVLKQRPEMLGVKNRDAPFPVLLKLIDAEQNTSLQVHPTDEYARAAEGECGKNEMWYVLDARPDTKLILGLNTAVTREMLREKMTDNTILEIVRFVPVKKGDCFLIPAGMLHAIGAGALIAEVQQNSNITYRVYDYGRLDAQGNLRKLHLDNAIDVINSELKSENRAESALETKFDGYRCTPLTDWRWFRTELLLIESRADFERDEESFTCLFLAEGSLLLKWGAKTLPFCKGESVFIPACLGTYSLIGTGKVLSTTV